MEKIGRIKDGNMLISGEIEERLPAVTKNLVAHFPFDGTYSKVRSFKGIKVLFQKSTGQTIADGIIPAWIKSQGGLITEVADLTTVTVDVAKQYDLVIADHYVWGVTEAQINKMKEFVDAGVSCISQGNDTRTNYFVKTYNATGIAAHDILIDENSPLDLSGVLVGGSADLYGGIVELQNGALPLYRRMDSGFITGWYYQSPISGAVLYHDQEGASTYNFVTQSMRFALENSQGGIKANDVVIANDGLYTQRSTTNRWTGTLKIYNNFSQPATLTATGEIFMGQPVYRLAMTVTDATRLSDFQNNLSSHGVFGGSMTFLASTKYAASIYYKLINKQDTIVGGTASNIGGWSVGPTEEISDGWKRYTQYRTGAATTNATDNVFFSFRTPSLQLNETVYIDFACPMIEDGKDFATAYTIGTTGSVASVEISNVNLQDYSISFKFKPTVEFYKTETTAYNRQMLAMVDTVNNREVRYADYLSTPSATATTSSPFFDFEPNASFGTGSNYHYHANYGYVKNRWHNMIITRSGNQLRIYVELDGVVLRDQTFTTVLDSTFTFGKLTLGWPSSSVWDGAFKDVSIYDVVLTDAEIKKLTSSRLNITTSGKIITSGVIERPHTPWNVKYFPLGGDGSSEHSYIQPLQELNTTYQNGALWLGSAYTNLFTHSTNGIFTVSSGKAFDVITNTQNEVIYKYKYSGETTNYKGRDVAVTGGRTYIASIEIFVSKDYNGTQDWFANIEQTGGGGFTYDMTKKGTWQKFTRTFTPTVDGNSRLLMYPAANNASGTQGYVLYKNFQIIDSVFERPFVNGTRDYQRLNYKTSDLTVNDWQEFSMVLTANYSQAGVWRISGAWSKFYFGVNPSNQIVFSWVESGTQKTYAIGTVPTGKWVTIGLSVKNNTFIELYLNGEQVGRFASTFQLNGTATNFELNSIEPASTSYPLNSWIKDFIVAPRALTAEEMSIIAKKHMSSNKNQIQVRGQILEGQTLV